MTSVDSDTSQDIAEAISLKGGRYLEAQVISSEAISLKGGRDLEAQVISAEAISLKSIPNL